MSHNLIKEAKMQKWEFCHLLWTMFEVSEEDIEEVRELHPDSTILEHDGQISVMSTLAFFPSVEVTETRVYKGINDALRSSGSEGWELVNVVKERNINAETLYFKRPFELDTKESRTQKNVFNLEDGINHVVNEALSRVITERSS